MEDKSILLLRYALGVEDKVKDLSEDDWWDYYDFCLSHSILGVGFQAIEKWTKNKKPPKKLILTWLSDVSNIERNNTIFNEKCLQLQKMFYENGYKTCILKGQANALMYEDPLRRQCGDIDIWVGGGAKSVINFLREKYNYLDIGYHHAELEESPVAVEVHYRPTWLSSPLRNYRLQRWFQLESEIQLKNTTDHINASDMAFNTVFQLTHIFNHFIQEGIGLRQIIDYYYVLQNRESKDVMPLLDKLGLSGFAGAMMYVMQTIFLLPEKKLLCAPDVYEGVFLLKEILVSGNFGRYDTRNKALHQKSGVVRKFYQMKRSLRYLRSYPEEVLCSPFRIYHVIWRKLELWRWE